MKVVCAWCKKKYPDKPPFDDASTSHTICPICAEKQLFKAEKIITSARKTLLDALLPFFKK